MNDQDIKSICQCTHELHAKKDEIWRVGTKEASFVWMVNHAYQKKFNTTDLAIIDTSNGSFTVCNECRVKHI